jgi:hypothetical protein
MAVAATCVATFIVTPRRVPGTYSDDPNDIYQGQLYTFTASLPHKCYSLFSRFYGGNAWCNQVSSDVIRTRWSQVIAKSEIDGSEIVVYEQKNSCHEIDLVSYSITCTCPADHQSIECDCLPCCIAEATIQALCGSLNPYG